MWYHCGMPVHRRQWLRQAGAATCLIPAASLWVPAFVKQARAADEPRFALGVASGQPRPDSVVLWTRLSGDHLPDRVEVSWELSTDERFAHVVQRGVELAERAWAHSVHVQPQGLEAGRPYWYRFRALGDQSRTGRTRTAPAPDAEATLRFAIASCQRWDYGHYAAWRDITAFDPDLVMFLGDYIYEYPTAVGAIRPVTGARVETLQDYRDRYALYKSDPLLQDAHASCPWLLIWDDHEVENDHAGLQSERLSTGFALQRAAAYQAYWEHMPFPLSARPRGHDMRIYGHLDWGRLARVLMLDDRQYRDVQVCPRPGRGGSNTVALRECPELSNPQRTLLGAEQEQWLARTWSKTHAWNLLAQQTLMARLAGRNRQGDVTYWTDGWDGYAPARNRLLGTAAAQRVPGLVALGGDVHAHYVAQLKADYDDPHSPVVGAEFCGTSISSRGPAQSRLDAARADNPHLLYANATRRGSVHFIVNSHALHADLRAVDDARNPASPVRSAGRYVVESGRPEVHPA